MKIEGWAIISRLNDTPLEIFGATVKFRLYRYKWDAERDLSRRVPVRQENFYVKEVTIDITVEGS